MSAKVLKFVRSVNGVAVEQRVADGYINATAMCQASGKLLSDYLRLASTQDYFLGLSTDMGIPISALVQVRKGGESQAQGTWVHPEVAVDLGKWCSTPLRIAVNRWVVEWMAAGYKPSQSDIDQEYVAWQQRYDIRIYLKDILRPELMNEVRDYAIAHKLNPIKLCSEVHDTMNERIQGARSQALKAMGGLPLASLLRDYFGAPPLHGYSTITQLVKVAIVDHGVEPIQAVHDACDSFFGKSYSPKPIPIVENLYKQGRRLKAAKRVKQLAAGIQLNFLEQGEAC